MTQSLQNEYDGFEGLGIPAFKSSKYLNSHKKNMKNLQNQNILSTNSY
jgi:hypothetical protein